MKILILCLLLFFLAGCSRRKETIEQNIKELEEQLKAKEHKAWDFGLGNASKTLHMRGSDWWSFSTAPNEYGKYDESYLRIYGFLGVKPDIKVLGNLKDIIDQGPIVVGLSVEEAKAVLDWYCTQPENKLIQEKIRKVLERYSES